MDWIWNITGGNIQGCCWKSPLLDAWETNGFFRFFCFIWVEGNGEFGSFLFSIVSSQKPVRLLRRPLSERIINS